ncbi:MAG TPA: hypothetical protein VLJ59_04995 [Mycobacteriales bacterium]|nr:hypothetical protein [Mycobacteriales bacterium]
MFDLGDVHPAPGGVAGDLAAVDPADGEVARAGMGKDVGIVEQLTSVRPEAPLLHQERPSVTNQSPVQHLST